MSGKMLIGGKIASAWDYSTFRVRPAPRSFSIFVHEASTVMHARANWKELSLREVPCARIEIG
ncbi:hypothetical protein BofuT4_uP146140.1 [Botrytis cinerea T4]|uniref:Uncharacterized protein n=1 Tax=Botryotinia fuckeliana (strain T4) TaxID=999810 RepID=G2YXU7_BOTF4|nr:hypothetical protein BofuT4_uP146140.1 [Botrytis cinerea T4]